MLSVIIPAHNEAKVIAACLSAVMQSRLPAIGMEVLVIANGCSDDTVAIAQRFAEGPVSLQVLDLPEGGKMAALNAGDDAARGDMRAYLDADVVVSPDLLEQIAAALDTDTPRYASGQVQIPRAHSAVTRAFARFYLTVPFMRIGVPGCGLFAVNAAGRRRWDQFPDIIADDTYVRLSFTPDERIGVPGVYSWPLVEGLRNLIKVRRRQDAGVAEIAARYPDLLQNDDKLPYPKAALALNALRMPLAFCTYVLVRLCGKLGRDHTKWSRGR